MNTGSFVTLDSTTYPIPDILVIHPGEIWDDKEQVFRIALGKPNMTVEDEAFYKPLFASLDKYLLGNEGFISDIRFTIGESTLTFKIAYVMRTYKQFGLFYDIEAALNEIKIEGIEKLEQITY